MYSIITACKHLNMSTFIWIIFMCCIGGSVVVLERSNLTLPCSYKGKNDRQSYNLSVMFSEIPIGINYPITRLHLKQTPGKTCTELFNFNKQYGHQCFENSVFTITIYNVTRDINRTQWLCDIMSEREAATRGNTVTLLVEEYEEPNTTMPLPDMNTTSSVPTETFIHAGTAVGCFAVGVGIGVVIMVILKRLKYGQRSESSAKHEYTEIILSEQATSLNQSGRQPRHYLTPIYAMELQNIVSVHENDDRL
ncbi:uncharacterized protein LOC127873478 isoform X2 [Dreissena polymorpha]|uniref:uncharacterized protein LOC127873478 isoform X2 n=1 Tax=Dreissena polymorpha TaxID=45954 RepID=UPI002264F0E4|nr:uncharacterized protein LOC127873478 isoform X2 [Dreissena polymorpha]